MPRLFVPNENLGQPTLTLTGQDHRYLTRVLRLDEGAHVDLFDGRGLEIDATIVSVGSREVILSLGDRRQVTRPPTPPVTLLQGLPRAERMDLVVQKATELGATRIIPVRTARSATGQQARSDRWERIAREAGRQCGRADLPDISPVLGLADAIASLALGTIGVVPWEEAPDAATLAATLAGPAATATGQPWGAPPVGVAVLIGPEGGLTADEVELATKAGFLVVTLGPRILRTETAAIATLAVIQSLVGGLG